MRVKAKSIRRPRIFQHLTVVSSLTMISASACAADFFGYTGSPFVVPDGNPNGAWSTVTVQDSGPILTGLTVNLTVNGGYNGDLYAYLSYNGRLIPLLNRIGLSSGNAFGWNGAGMTLSL